MDESKELGVFLQVGEEAWEYLGFSNDRNFQLIGDGVQSSPPKVIKKEKRKYPVIVRPDCRIATTEKYEIDLYKGWIVRGVHYKDITGYPVNEYLFWYLPYEEYFYEVYDTSKYFDLRIYFQWLLLPFYKKAIYYLRYRYRLIKSRISRDYEKPTFARAVTDSVSLLSRWFLKWYRKSLDILCSWVRYYVRLTYKQLFGDNDLILDAIIGSMLIIMLSYSYMTVADVYSESSGIQNTKYTFNVKPEIIYELGEQVYISPETFLEDDSLGYAENVKLDTELITSKKYYYDEDTETVTGRRLWVLPCGEYPVNIKYRGEVRESKIIVKDTTPPDIENCALYNNRLVKVVRGMREIDLRSLIVAGVNDASLSEEIHYNTGSLRIISDTDKINTSKRGRYKVKVAVEDKYGNRSETFTITVLVV